MPAEELGGFADGSSPPHGLPWSHRGSHEAVLNSTSRAPRHPDSIEAELIKQIADLELQVLHLERNLLSLYRATFNRCFANSPAKDQSSHSPSTSSQLRDAVVRETRESQPVYLHQPSVCINACSDKMGKSCTQEKKNELHPKNFRKQPGKFIADSEDGNIPSTGMQLGVDYSEAITHRPHCLADHFGSSLVDCVSEAPGRLSEEMIRCIASIYNKISEQPVSGTDLSVSPVSSLSSSSPFSPRDTNDAWSPMYYFDYIMSPYHKKVRKDKQGPYSRMLNIRKVRVDGEIFKYVEKMLQIFSALIARLESLDPIKLEHEEKLAFWINIHNALVMHAFLVYGLRRGYVKNTSSILKATYNVGGFFLNALEIQSFVFHCHPHRPELRLRKLFSGPEKPMKRRGQHPFAVDRQQPLVHFALCMGASSDPAVRIYSANNVLEELNLAKREFIQSTVSIGKEAKIILPKVLQYYARDAVMDMSGILNMVYDCLPEAQQGGIVRRLKGKPERCVGWSSYKAEFRFIIHEDLTGG